MPGRLDRKPPEPVECPTNVVAVRGCLCLALWSLRSVLVENAELLPGPEADWQRLLRGSSEYANGKTNMPR